MKALFRLVGAIACAATFSAVAQPAATFDVFEYAVEGNTVLETIDIERAVYPWLGPGKTAEDVEKARAALETIYQQNGYLSVSVVLPVQSVAEGVIRLQVIEGEVEKLKVSGNQYTLRSELRKELPELAPGKVPHFPTMQAELANAGRSAERRVTPLLRPGSRPGTMEVEIAVEDELPLHGNIELNTRQSPDTSKTRLEAGIRYANLFQRGHSAGLNYVVSPEDASEVSVLAGFYSAPLSPTRSLSAFFQYSNSDIASAIGSNVVGRGTTFGLRLSQTLPQPAGIEAFFHSLSLGIDFKNLQETQDFPGIDRKQTPLRYHPFMAQYSFNHFGGNAELSGNLSMVANPATGSRDVECYPGIQTDQFECRRARARPSFSALRGDIAYTRRLLGWEAMARMDFQLSGQALVSTEQFIAGGGDSVRGYYEGEASGDKGWRVRFEVQTPAVADIAGTGLRLAGFVEGANLWLNNAQPGQTADFKVLGAGLGLRLKGEKHGPFLVLDAARALRAGPRTDKGDFRLHARMGYEF